MKSYLICLLLIFSVNVTEAACPATPTKPSPYPAAGSTAMTVRTTTAGVSLIDMPGAGNFTLPSISSNIDGGNVNGVTNIYVRAGESLTISTSYNINGGGVLNVYVELNATLNLSISGTLNGGNFVNFGTMNYNVGGIQNASNFYIIGAGASLTATSAINLTSSTGQFVIDGGTIVANDIQVNTVPADEFCMRNGGCISASDISLNNTVGTFSSDDGNGYLYLRNIYTANPNQVILNTTNTPKVCTGEAPQNAKWCGGDVTCRAKVKSSCSPSPATCAGAIVLPVSLRFFKVNLTTEGVNINWGSNRTWDSDRFIVEKSKNGYYWESVGTLKSVNSQTYKEYGILDPTPSSGGNYYKLSEIDINGKTTPYSIQYIEVDKESEHFTIYPNPNNGNFTISIGGDYKVYSLEITNSEGLKIRQLTLNNGLNILKNELPAGIFFAKLKIGNEYKIRKLVVN